MKSEMKSNDEDEVLPSGTIIHWGNRDPEGGSKVSVTCGMCGSRQFISASSIRSQSFTGFCQECKQKGSAKRGKTK